MQVPFVKQPFPDVLSNLLFSWDDFLQFDIQLQVCRLDIWDGMEGIFDNGLSVQSSINVFNLYSYFIITTAENFSINIYLW